MWICRLSATTVPGRLRPPTLILDLGYAEPTRFAMAPTRYSCVNSRPSAVGSTHCQHQTAVLSSRQSTATALLRRRRHWRPLAGSLRWPPVAVYSFSVVLAAAPLPIPDKASFYATSTWWGSACAIPPRRLSARRTCVTSIRALWICALWNGQDRPPLHAFSLFSSSSSAQLQVIR
jgi:hypothetical protein